MEPTPGDLAERPPVVPARTPDGEIHPARLLMAADDWVLVEVDDALSELRR